MIRTDLLTAPELTLTYPGIDPATTVAFTGHRSYKMTGASVPGSLFFGTQEHDPVKLREILAQTITTLYLEGYTTFLSGMAEGFDMMAAETVLELKVQYPSIDLIAVVPFPGQATRMSSKNKDAYKDILSSCNTTYTVCSNYRPDCFHRRNDALIANSSVMVCYYNGSRGGTHYTVNLAKKKGHRVINLFPLY